MLLAVLFFYSSHHVLRFLTNTLLFVLQENSSRVDISLFLLMPKVYDCFCCIRNLCRYQLLRAIDL